jgi:glutaredoxin 3
MLRHRSARKRGFDTLPLRSRPDAPNLRAIGIPARRNGEPGVVPLAQIYTSGFCGYCIAAKNFLKNRGIDCTEVRIDQEAGKLAEMLQRSGGRRTVPQIFIGGVHVGGYDDLVAADRNGKLAQLMTALGDEPIKGEGSA